MPGAPFSPTRFILLCLYRKPQPEKPRRAHTTGPKPTQLKTPIQKTQSKTPTPKPRTLNNHKWANIRKNYKEKTWEKIQMPGNLSLLIIYHPKLLYIWAVYHFLFEQQERLCALQKFEVFTCTLQEIQNYFGKWFLKGDHT